VDILALLQNAYLRNGDAEKAENAERRLDHKRSLIESRNFLELAKHFEADGLDYIWALEIAAHVKIENEFSHRAQERLMELQDYQQWPIVVKAGGGTSLDKGRQEAHTR
jgi:hypothetical protein